MVEVEKYPGYFVTKDGQVWSNKTNRILKPLINRKGYKIVKLTNSRSDQWTVSVHRLVAQYYLEGRFEGAQVNHKDGNKLNNCADNLEWATCAENIRHAWKTGLHKKSRKGSANSQAKLTERKVSIIKNRLSRGDSITQIAADYGVDHSNIWQIAKGKTWQHV